MKKILSKLFLGVFLLGLILPATSASAGNVSILTSAKNLTTGGASAQEISVNSNDNVMVLARVLNDTPVTTGNLAFYAKLPSGMSLVSGSSKLTFRAANGTDQSVALGDSISSSNGVMIGDVVANSFVYVSYRVTTSAAGSYSVRNEAYNGSNINVASNSAKINVGGFAVTVVQGQNPVVGSQDATSGITVKSLIANYTKGETNFKESTVASRGDELYYSITISNTSNATAKALAAYAQIPYGLQYVSGYSKLSYTDANGVDQVAPLNDNLVKATGIMIGDLPANHYEYLIYKVRVSSDIISGTYFTGNQVFNNNINVSDNTGRVMIDVVGTDAPVSKQALSINATAYNETQAATVAYTNSVNANRGDVIKFHVAFKNTSDAVLKNTKITNSLPANMEYVAGSAKTIIGGTTVNVPDNKTVSLGDLGVGANGILEFSAKVKSDTPANIEQLTYAANGIADGISQVSSVVNIYLAGTGEKLPSTGPIATILALIVLAAFISVASYMYLKESNALKSAAKLIQR
jgi:uncharacterized repeat protein (TIGR01451 family)